jgi:uncharacterized protein
MKIWIDLTNSPHINFFKPFIYNWTIEGHQIILTVRDLANTIQLVNQNGWEHTLIGGHVGKNRFKKVIYFPKRVYLLFRFLKRNRPDIGISHSSFYSPGVCRLLKIPSIYLNDNEYAKGNYLAFKFATLNMLPEPLSIVAKQLKWTDRYAIEFYPGIKEGIYLSQMKIGENDSQKSLLRQKIYIRLEPWTAEYYKGKADFLDPIIRKLIRKHEVVLLPRNIEQIAHYKQREFEGIKICEDALDLETILNECRLFIGAGGSMTRELAYMGIPTLSVYQGALLSVDKYLIKNGILMYDSNPKIGFIEGLLEEPFHQISHILAAEGMKAYNLINKKLHNLVNQNIL